MSRKTAVCVLFVLVLTLGGAAAPAQALTDDSPSIRVLIGEQGPANDPDGVQASTPTAAGGTLLQMIRQILGYFIL